jgi:hypothetical protein
MLRHEGVESRPAVDDRAIVLVGHEHHGNE